MNKNVTFVACGAAALTIVAAAAYVIYYNKKAAKEAAETEASPLLNGEKPDASHISDKVKDGTKPETNEKKRLYDEINEDFATELESNESARKRLENIVAAYVSDNYEPARSTAVEISAFDVATSAMDEDDIVSVTWFDDETEPVVPQEVKEAISKRVKEEVDYEPLYFEYEGRCYEVTISEKEKE